MATIWKLEAAYNEYDECSGDILYFHKKENAEKVLRKWVKEETEYWKQEEQDPTWWPNCKTWDDVLEWYMSRSGDFDVAWIEPITFEDEEEEK